MRKRLMIIGACLIAVGGLLFTLASCAGAPAASGFYNMTTLKSAVQPMVSTDQDFVAGATVASCSLTSHSTDVLGSPGRVAVCMVREDGGVTVPYTVDIYDHGNSWMTAPSPG